MVNIANELYAVNHSEIGKFYDNNESSIKKLYSLIPEEERVRIGAEILYALLWDDKLLGEFKSGLFALTLAYVIQKVVGAYKISKYASIVLNKGKPLCEQTEEKFDKIVIETLYNMLIPNYDPLKEKLVIL